MKKVPTYSLLAAYAAVGIDARWQIKALSSSDSVRSISDGKEFIIPVYVEYHDSKYAFANGGFANDQEKYESDDSKLFWILSKYTQELSSVHSDDLPWTFDAHYRGRDTSYFKHTKDEPLRGGNLILSSSGVDYFWEGDEFACQAITIKGTAGDNTFSDAKASNKCTFFEAREYCHRHGGELLLPDEYFWEYFIKPMCATSHEKGKDANILKTGLTSGVKYWLNIQKVYSDHPDNKIGNIRTTATVHLHNLFGEKNTYTGINKSLNLVGLSKLNEPQDNYSADVLKFRNYYEYLINRDSSNHYVREDLASTAFELLANHEMIGVWDSDSRLKDPSGTKRSQHEYAMEINRLRNNNQLLDLNMSYLSRQLKANGAVSQACSTFTCNDSNNKDLQDFPCDLNNIRPLCMTKEFLRPHSDCPVNLDITHCGDNVQEVLMESVWNLVHESKKLAAWGLPNGATGALAAAKTTIDGVEYTMNINYVEVVNALINKRVKKYLVDNNEPDTTDAAVDAWLEGENKKKLQLYINCMGTFDATKGTDGMWVIDDKDAVAICEQYNYQYVCAADYDAVGADKLAVLTRAADVTQVTLTSDTKVGAADDTTCTSWYVRNHKANCQHPNDRNSCVVKCECADCNAPEHDTSVTMTTNKIYTETPAVADDELKPLIQITEYTLECPVDYTMTSTAYDAHINKATNADNCKTHSLVVKCKDKEDPTSDAQILPFYTAGRTEALSNTARALYIWKTDGTKGPEITASALKEDLKCIPVPCAKPTAILNTNNNAHVNAASAVLPDDAAWVGKESTYYPEAGKNQIVDGVHFAQCNAGFCGKVNYQCDAVCPLAWSYVATGCVPATCNTPSKDGILFEADPTVAGKWYASAIGVNNVLEDNGVAVANKHPVQCDAAELAAKTGLDAAACGVDVNLALLEVKPLKCKFTPDTVPNLCPASQGLQEVTVPITKLVGEEMTTCQCLPGWKKVSGSCTSTCTNPGGDVIKGLGVPTVVTCQCEPPSCPKPADIPHGKPTWLGRNANPSPMGTPIARGAWDNADWDNNGVDVDQKPKEHDWVSYKCDQGYELRYTDNDEVATIAGCARQCYLPNNHCGDVAKTNWASDESFWPILDPLNCYCAPKICAPPVDATPGANHQWDLNSAGQTDADTIKSKSYFPVAGFNTIDVKCNSGFLFSGSSPDVLNCGVGNPTAWTSPSSVCKNHACKDPRQAGVANSYYAASLNLDHTCASKDQAHKGGENDAWVDKANFAADIVFAADANNDWAYTLEGQFAGAKIKEQQAATMVNGSKYRVYCKKGFMPYFNSAVVMSNGQTGPSQANHFDCTCNNGQWVCNYVCRCDGFCDDWNKKFADLMDGIPVPKSLDPKP